jgi:hypothetical protein
MKPTFRFLFFLLFPGVTIAQSDCLNSLVITPGIYEMTGYTGSDAPEGMCLNPADQYAWYSFTPTENVFVSVGSNLPENAGLDTRVSVYVGLCGSTTCVGSDDDSGGGFLSLFSWNALAGVTYNIVWDDFWQTTPFSFELIEAEPIENLVNFTPGVITLTGNAICVVDMNGDHLDDIVSENGNILNIGYQQMDGSFNVTSHDVGSVTYSPYWSIAAGDLDNNGFTDLVYCGSGASFIWANDDGTGYSETHDPNYIFCQRSNTVDLNSDGNLDVFVCHDVEPNVYFIHDGNQGMTYYQGGMGETYDGGNYGSVFIDYDNDCDMDLFIAKCRGGASEAKYNQLHRNNGDGTFTEVSVESGLWDPVQTWSSAWADFDNDGDMDVMIGASSFSDGGHKLMQNNGDGTFTDISEGSGIENHFGTSIENYPGDFNNDGWVDVYGLGNFMAINNGDMTFTISNMSPTYGPVGDLNNDGFLDVLSTSFFGGPTAHINDGNDNNWLVVNTVGTQSNKSGIGARITLHTNSGQQIRDVRSGQGFAKMQSLNTHFGLGTDTEIDLITVCWPSGIVDEIQNPDINQSLEIVEGSTVGVDEMVIDKINLYPNPATGIVRLNLDNPSAFNYISIFDLSGKLIRSEQVFNAQFDISDLASGMYNVRVFSAGNVYQTKLAVE